MLRRSLLAALVAVVAPTLVAQAASRFNDIPSGHWGERAAVVLDDRGVFPGRTPVNFAGDAALTRYELAKVVSALFPNQSPPSTFIALSDMPPGHYATLEVQRVLGYDLMKMRTPGTFDGNGLVTRVDLVTALDTLLMKSGIAPPARRPQPLNYRDVDPRTPLGQVLERVVNRYKLVDPEPFSNFNPYNSVPRYQALSMVLRALSFLNPALADEIRRPAATPAPTWDPGQTPAPTPTPAPTRAPAGSPRPGASPTPGPDGLPRPAILTSRATLGAELVLAYTESLPEEAGLTTPTEQKEFFGNMLGGGRLGGEIWQERVGGSFGLGAFYVPIDVPRGPQSVPEDLADIFAQGAGYYKFAGGADWEAAAGAGALIRYTYNVSAQLVNSTYQTADKLYVGAGPALAWGWRAAPELAVTGSLVTYPAIFQSYDLSNAPKSLTRWGADATARAEYQLAPGWFVTGGGHLFVSGAFAGGMQSLLGVTAGVGRTF